MGAAVRLSVKTGVGTQTHRRPANILGAIGGERKSSQRGAVARAISGARGLSLVAGPARHADAARCVNLP
jgi:hypothetical protein